MKHNSTIEWNDAQIAELTQLWAAGFTAEVIGAQFGTSRSAITGKVHRLMLPVRGKRITERKALPKAVPVVRLPPPVRIEPQALGPIADFPGPGTCRYIAGDPASQEWQCCGAATVHVESRWCEFHHGVVYQPSKPRNVTPEPRRVAA